MADSPLKNLEKNSKLLSVFLQAMQEDHLSREDFTKAFDELTKMVERLLKAAKDELDQNNNSLSEKVTKDIEAALQNLSKAEQALAEKYEQLDAATKSDARTTMRYIDQKMRDFEDMLPEDYDDAEVLSRLSVVEERTKDIPTEFDPTDIYEEHERLKEEIAELKKRPTGTGSGVTNARIIQAMKYAVKTEAPVGDIDGANTSYTVSQPIFAVLSFSLNGEFIAQIPNYTVAGNTITFTSALPAAYSGKDFEVTFF